MRLESVGWRYGQLGVAAIKKKWSCEGWVAGRAATYIEDTLCLPPRRLVVPLCQGDELIRQALCLLGLGPCCLYRLLLDERGDQVAKEGLPVGRVAAEGPEFHVTTCHLC